MEVYVQSEHELIEEEVKTFQEISNDEWNLLRETPTERVANIMNRMKTRLRKVKFSYQTNFSCLFTILKISFPPYRNEDHCGNCINWHVKALQLVNLSQGTEVVEVGKWEPLQGMVHMDDLFPHIMGGLRGRTLRVASYDVSFIFTSRKKYFIFSVSQVLREIKVSKCSVSNVAIFHIERLSIVIIMIFCTF